MKRFLRLVRLATIPGLGIALACGGSSEAQNETRDEVREIVAEEVDQASGDAEPAEDVPAGAPRVAETYQRTIDRGWTKAVEGETPAYACAGLKGRVMGTGQAADPAAVEALFACNVLLPTRYFETYLDSVEAGEKSCTGLLTELSTQLSAMTLSIDDVQGMVDAFAEAETEGGETGAAAGALAGAVDRATLEAGLEDPERLIKERLAERVRSACPDEAAIILR